MNNENNEPENKGVAKEKIEGIAQVVIGEIESLGGVITGDPTTSAEGDFNVQVGTLHEKSADALSETDEAAESQTSNENNKAENVE